MLTLLILSCLLIKSVLNIQKRIPENPMKISNYSSQIDKPGINDLLLNEIESDFELETFTDLFNLSEKMDILLDSSIYNRKAIFHYQNKNVVVYYVIYAESFDGYFVFLNEQNVCYRFSSKEISNLVTNNIPY